MKSRISEAANQDDETLPKATIKHKRFGSLIIWVVPLVAALAAGYLIYQHVHEAGSTISIRFRDVEGILPGQTSIRYRGADVGEVTAVDLSQDHEYAIVKAKLRRSAQTLAREKSVFWIVRPQLSMGNLTGLGTIITGPYITVLSGGGAAANQFTGLEDSPLVLDPQGLEVVLLSSHASSLRAGVPVYYRGLEVGAVKETQLSPHSRAVEIRAVIQKRYAALVTTETKFWNVAGLDVHVGLFKGAQVNVESLKSLLIGGIAFATPESPRQAAASKDVRFQLYDEPEKKWLEWSPRIELPPENPAATNSSPRALLPQVKTF